MHHESSVVIITEYWLLIYINTLTSSGAWLLSHSPTQTTDRMNAETLDNWKRSAENSHFSCSWIYAADFHLLTIKWARLRSSSKPTSACHPLKFKPHSHWVEWIYSCCVSDSSKDSVLRGQHFSQAILLMNELCPKRAETCIKKVNRVGFDVCWL